MRTDIPQTIYLKDYTPPAWWIDTVDLQVAIHDGYAEVRARLGCRRNPQMAQGAALVLNGEALDLQKVLVETHRAGVGGTALDATGWRRTSSSGCRR